MDKKLKTIQNTRVIYKMVDPGNPDETDWTEAESYITLLNEFDTAGNLVLAETYDSNEDIVEKYVYVYDEQNRLISEKAFFDNDDIAETTTEYFYEEMRKTSEKISYREGGSSLVKYTYNSDGAVCEKISLSEDYETEERTEVEFNGKLPVSEKTFDENNELKLQKLFSYDGQNNLTELKTTVVEEGIAVNSRETYEYNAPGLLARKLIYDTKDFLKAKEIYEYDEQNRLAEMTEEDSSNLKTTKLQYDEQGNNILQEEFNRDGELMINIERKFDPEGNVLEASVYIEKQMLRPASYYSVIYDYEYFE